MYTFLKGEKYICVGVIFLGGVSFLKFITSYYPFLSTPIDSYIEFVLDTEGNP